MPEAFRGDGGVSHQLYRHYDAAGALLYVGIALCSMQRLAQHKFGFERIHTVRIEHFADEDTARRAEALAVQEERPLFNRQIPRVRDVVQVELALHLEEQGITQQRFGEMVGASQALVSQWLSGLKAITPEYAKIIEEKTGIKRMRLLYPEEERGVIHGAIQSRLVPSRHGNAEAVLP